MERLRRWLGTGAELVGAGIFAAMFGTFLLQIFMRYVVVQPLGWTLEVCMMAYIWLAFWGSAFLLRERDHVAFNIIYVSVPPKVRRVLAGLSALCLGGAMVAALPDTWDFVTFMEVMSTDVLRVRFDIVFMIFVVFMAAVALRQAVHLWQLLRPGWERHL